MSLPHRFDLEAFTEYEEAACHYAEQQPGLESRFIASVENAIDRLCETPERWRGRRGAACPGARFPV